MDEWVDERLELLDDMEYRREQAEQVSRLTWEWDEDDAELEAWDVSIDAREAGRPEPEAWEVEQDRQQVIIRAEQELERKASIEAVHERMRRAAAGESGPAPSTSSRLRKPAGPTAEPGPDEGPEAWEAWRKKRAREQIAACGEYWD